MTLASSGGPLRVLLVEDNPGDVRLIRETIVDSPRDVELAVAEDGETALALLRKEPPHEDAVRPDLMLLDLNLPGISGGEVLAKVKADPALKSIPVVVLTSSREEQDIIKSYELQAGSYVTKPVDPDEFSRIVDAVANYWSAIATLPTAPNKYLPK